MDGIALSKPAINKDTVDKRYTEKASQRVHCCVVAIDSRTFSDAVIKLAER